jgi:hypothetical protein
MREYGNRLDNIFSLRHMSCSVISFSSIMFI